MSKRTLAQALDALAQMAENAASEPLNNLNLKNNIYLNKLNYLNSLNYEPTASDLNNLKPEGVTRLELYTDETLKKALSWGVEEWLLHVCIRDYGLHTVKGQINRLYQIPEGYFKPQYGPIPGQRGRLFNTEMKRLRERAAIRSHVYV